MSDNITRQQITDGIQMVSTASHGYLEIREDVAQEKLSQVARSYGELAGGVYRYEHDVAISIPLLDSKEIFDLMIATNEDPHRESIRESIRKNLITTLSLYNPEYLVKVGIEPDPVAKQKFDVRAIEQKMRDEKHPDLVISAAGEWKSMQKDKVVLHTADGEMYFGDKKLYQARNHNAVNNIRNYAPTPYENPVVYYENFLVGKLEKLMEKHSDDRDKLADGLDSVIDDFRSALTTYEEYKYGQCSSLKDRMTKSNFLTHAIIERHEWRAGTAMSDPEFRSDIFNTAKNLARDRLASALDNAPSNDSLGMN